MLRKGNKKNLIKWFLNKRKKMNKLQHETKEEKRKEKKNKYLSKKT